MATQRTYRVRFRFWVQTKLDLGEKERRIAVAGRRVVLSAHNKDFAIADSHWLVMNAGGFESEGEAIEFAGKLKASVELALEREEFSAEFRDYLSGVDLA